MSDLLRFLLLIVLGGAAVTVLAAGFAWWSDEARRLTRYCRRALDGAPDAILVAKARRAAIAFRLENERLVVMADSGARARLYPLEALMGGELLVDGQVAARTYRGETRRALDRTQADADEVTLRLLFDDPREPDFDLDLWPPLDGRHRDAPSPSAAIDEGRRWLARAEAILRRPPPRPPRSDPVVGRPAPEPIKDELEPDPPFDEDDEDDLRL